MKYLFTLLCLFATSAMAHEDHALNDTFHIAYHIAFWSLFALVAYKGVMWFKAKRQSKNK
ncbi:MAG: hypothetical protein ABJH06_18045 [Paraglaciecola sp.]|uniref:hypothetical protein n=1 Tax=Paraglaciecola sp. TaxID=1920173 RepID=UPI00329761F0